MDFKNHSPSARDTERVRTVMDQVHEPDTFTLSECIEDYLAFLAPTSSLRPPMRSGGQRAAMMEVLHEILAHRTLVRTGSDGRMDR